MEQTYRADFWLKVSKFFFETFKVALQCHFLMLGCQNESKMASEISKIHFWGRKIKFSFWLNKCFWNILQLIKHIQEGYFSNFRVIDLNISHVCSKYESENDMRDILDPINPPLFPTCTANQRTNLRLQPKLQNFCDCLY